MKKEDIDRLISFRKIGYFGQEEKEDLEFSLKRELKSSSEFAAFKRWLIKDNKEYYADLLPLVI